MSEPSKEAMNAAIEIQAEYGAEHLTQSEYKTALFSIAAIIQAAIDEARGEEREACAKEAWNLGDRRRAAAIRARGVK